MPEKFTVSSIEEAYTLLPECNDLDIIKVQTQNPMDVTVYEVHVDGDNKKLYPIGDINYDLNIPDDDDEGVSVGGRKIRRSRKSRRKSRSRKSRKSRSRKSRKSRRKNKRHTKRNK